MAHALHPNYADKHDPELAPRLGSGLVLKHNVNQRYATNAVSATLFRHACCWERCRLCALLACCVAFACCQVARCRISSVAGQCTLAPAVGASQLH